eukprot:TRINITY_DN5152_c0_g1_i12.p1 TRINITY_DN5152_c0_g1~~TRINITY_DN5152_c0_g1_i12.p1  ORF type:complete len:256 (+),score=55.13 TRINITY_DN5152_c0_g1_i12:421-1188(+)
MLAIFCSYHHFIGTRVNLFFPKLQPSFSFQLPNLFLMAVSALEASVSVNIFWGDSGTETFTKKLIDQKWEAFSYWMLNVMEQNHGILFRILPHISESLMNFLASQFRDIVSKETIQPLVDFLLNHYACSSIKIDTINGGNRSIDNPHSSRDMSEDDKMENTELEISTKPAKLRIRGLLWRGDWTVEKVIGDLEDGHGAKGKKKDRRRKDIGLFWDKKLRETDPEYIKKVEGKNRIEDQMDEDDELVVSWFGVEEA